MEYDVFVSHNRKDKPWVRELVSLLRSKGLKVFFDEDSIPYGADVVTAVEQGVERSRRILLVLSPKSVRSKWVALESSLGVYADPDARRLKIIPLLLEKTPRSKIKLSVRRLNMVDLTETETRESAFRKLFSELAIANPETIDLTPLLPSTAGTPSTSEPRVTNIFSFRSPAKEWYVSRREQESAEKILFAKDRNVPNLLVTGRTGVGKSSFLNWLDETGPKQGFIVTKCTPYSDRVADLLSSLAQNGVEVLESMDIQPPRIRGNPRTDCRVVFEKIAARSQSKVLVLVDQVERLFPPGMTSSSGISAVWDSLIEALGDLKTHPILRWVFAVKEWYFLSLFPTGQQLSVNNFTYITLSDLDHAAAVALVLRLAALAGVTIANESIDLIATKTGGRPIALILTFILAVERSPEKQRVEYEYLSVSEPWNDIFDADFSSLDSQRQKYIVLAMAHSGREVIPEEQVVRKVLQAAPYSGDEILEDIRRLDHDKGIIIRNEQFLSFVHSGFGVFVSTKYADQYPASWSSVQEGQDKISDLRRELFEADALRQSLALFAHRFGNVVGITRAYAERLEMAAASLDMEGIHKYSAEFKKSFERVIDEVDRLRSVNSRAYFDPNASTMMIAAVSNAVEAFHRTRPVALVHLNIENRAELETLRVLGRRENVEMVFVELLENAQNAVRDNDQPEIRIEIKRDKFTSTIICDVIDNGPGVSANVMPHLFDLGFTTSSKGTGFGLFLVRRTMEAFGGSIEVISARGQGLIFRLLFKLAEEN